MTRLQKKCLIGSACFHGLTAVVFLATAAFRSEPAIPQERVLTLVPFRILDRPGIGGEPAPAVVRRLPAQPATRPAPAPTPPQPPPAEPPRPAARTAPKPPARDAAADKPAPAPTRHGIQVDLTQVARSSKTPSRSAEASAAAREADKKRAQEMADIFAGLDSTLHSKEPASKVVDFASVGEGGGEAFVNYRTAVFNAYYQAWKTPEGTTHNLPVTDAKIVVLRDGTVTLSEIVNKSGDTAMDRSVQRALNAVRHLPPFPPGAQEAERSFIIRFNLEAKREAG